MSKIAQECEDYRLLLEHLVMGTELSKDTKSTVKVVLNDWRVYNDEGIENGNAES